MDLFKRQRGFIDSLQQTIQRKIDSDVSGETVAFRSNLTPDQVDRTDLGKLFGLVLLPVLKASKGTLDLTVASETATWCCTTDDGPCEMPPPPWRVAKALVDELSTDMVSSELEIKLDDRSVMLQIEKTETPDGSALRITKRN